MYIINKMMENVFQRTLFLSNFFNKKKEKKEEVFSQSIISLSLKCRYMYNNIINKKNSTNLSYHGNDKKRHSNRN